MRVKALTLGLVVAIVAGVRAQEPPGKGFEERYLWLAAKVVPFDDLGNLPLGKDIGTFYSNDHQPTKAAVLDRWAAADVRLQRSGELTRVCS